MVVDQKDKRSVLLPYRFTLFSNWLWQAGTQHQVLLPYRFTLFSNTAKLKFTICPVLLPYRFTLFSNLTCVIIVVDKFYYLIDLHYSQTTLILQCSALLFYYLIDLHYSQT